MNHPKCQCGGTGEVGVSINGVPLTAECCCQSDCQFCGKPATCYGQYEDQPEGYACSDCCGHWNEDGHCEPLKEENAEVSRGDGSAS